MPRLFSLLDEVLARLTAVKPAVAGPTRWDLERDVTKADRLRENWA